MSGAAISQKKFGRRRESEKNNRVGGGNCNIKSEDEKQRRAAAGLSLVQGSASVLNYKRRVMAL